MNVVFIHQNFPGQFRHIAGALAADPANRVLSISQPQAPGLPGVRNIVYRPARQVTREITLTWCQPKPASSTAKP